jgi:hypothetical protein
MSLKAPIEIRVQDLEEQITILHSEMEDVKKENKELREMFESFISPPKPEKYAKNARQAAWLNQVRKHFTTEVTTQLATVFYGNDLAKVEKTYKNPDLLIKYIYQDGHFSDPRYINIFKKASYLLAQYMTELPLLFF